MPWNRVTHTLHCRVKECTRTQRAMYTGTAREARSEARRAHWKIISADLEWCPDHSPGTSRPDRRGRR